MANQERVKQFFGRHAADYAANPGFRQGDDLSRLMELLEPRPEHAGLDVATATGHTAFALAERVRVVIGLDLTPEMEGEFARGADERGLTNLRFQLGEVDALPFPDAAFDVVTCRRAGHHFPDLGAALKEMSRVLKPGGRLGIIDMTAPEAGSIQLLNLLEIARDHSHVRACTPEEWTRLVTAAALKLERVEVQEEPMPWQRWLRPVSLDSDEACEAEQILADAVPEVRAELIRDTADGRVFLKRRVILTATR